MIVARRCFDFEKNSTLTRVDYARVIFRYALLAMAIKSSISATTLSGTRCQESEFRH